MLIRDLVCATVAQHYEDFQFYAATGRRNIYTGNETGPVTASISLTISLTSLAPPGTALRQTYPGVRVKLSMIPRRAALVLSNFSRLVWKCHLDEKVRARVSCPRSPARSRTPRNVSRVDAGEFENSNCVYVSTFKPVEFAER